MYECLEVCNYPRKDSKQINAGFLKDCHYYTIKLRFENRRKVFPAYRKKHLERIGISEIGTCKFPKDFAEMYITSSTKMLAFSNLSENSSDFVWTLESTLLLLDCMKPIGSSGDFP